MRRWFKNALIAGFVGCVINLIIEIVAWKFFGKQILVPATLSGNVRMFLSGCLIYSVIHFNFWLFRHERFFAFLGSLMGLFILVLACSAGIPLLLFTPTAALVIISIIGWSYVFVFCL